MSSSDNDPLHKRGKALEEAFSGSGDQELLKETEIANRSGRRAAYPRLGDGTFRIRKPCNPVLNIGHGMQVLAT